MPQAVDTALFCLYLYFKVGINRTNLKRTYPRYDKKHATRFYKTSMKIWFMQNEYK